MARLVSPNPICRRWGCQEHVPPSGYYSGMPQSHCYRCGMRTGCAAQPCADFVEPIGETWLDRLLVKWFPAKKTSGTSPEQRKEA